MKAPVGDYFVGLVLHPVAITARSTGSAASARFPMVTHCAGQLPRQTPSRLTDGHLGPEKKSNFRRYLSPKVCLGVIQALSNEVRFSESLGGRHPTFARKFRSGVPRPLPRRKGTGAEKYRLADAGLRKIRRSAIPPTIGTEICRGSGRCPNLCLRLGIDPASLTANIGEPSRFTLSAGEILAAHPLPAFPRRHDAALSAIHISQGILEFLQPQ